MRNIVDLTGKRFGSLTVVERAGKIGNHIAWICKCDCGTVTKPIAGNNLKNGHVKSCGCYKKHGMTGTRLYSIWAGMKSRCYNKKHIHYGDYGGRGITICDEWLNDFSAFAKWSLANGYTDELTIDRKDNTRDYSPDNCRWAAKKEQQNNRRNNIVIEYKGKSQTLLQWSEELHIDYHKLLMRIKRGWEIEKAFNKK